MTASRVVVARTVAEVEALREVWAAFPVENPAADLDYHLTLLEHAPAVVRPHVVLLESEGEPSALAVGRVEDVRLPATIGYKAVYRPRVRALTISQGGLLEARPGEAGKLLEILQGTLSSERLDALRLRFLPVGSPAHALATSVPGLLARQRFSTPVARWRARVPATFDEYLASRSSKTRSGIRRYGRRLEEEAGGGLTFRLFTAPEELDELVRDTRIVAEKTYQARLGAAFSDTELERRLLELALRRGWYRGFVLYLDGVPSAYWHGTAYRRTFFTGPTGYDPARRELRLGTYVLAKMVERLCGEVDWMDFGVGDAEYKRHFGDERLLEEDVLVYAPRLRPVAVNVLRSAVLGTSHAGRAVLARSGKLAHARRRWRGRLTGGASSGADG